ncbi:MAG: glutamine cyclotransferase, partial [Bacteroidales bacterium]|nr:glutamine cyclotransferase [Bacteroidales bacterium]
MRKVFFLLPLLLLVSVLIACGGSKARQSNSMDLTEEKVIVPQFNADSAYSFIEKQVSFGPRVPNTAGHKACGNYLEAKLKE